MKPIFLAFAVLLLSPVSGVGAMTSDPALACTEAVIPAVSTQRTYRNESLGFSLDIPENYRALARQDGSIEIVNPGTLDYVQCMLRAGHIDSVTWRYATLWITSTRITDADRSLSDLVGSVKHWLDQNQARTVRQQGREVLLHLSFNYHDEVDYVYIHFLSADRTHLVTLEGATDSTGAIAILGTLQFP